MLHDHHPQHTELSMTITPKQMVHSTTITPTRRPSPQQSPHSKNIIPNRRCTLQPSPQQLALSTTLNTLHDHHPQQTECSSTPLGRFVDEFCFALLGILGGGDGLTRGMCRDWGEFCTHLPDMFCEFGRVETFLDAGEMSRIVLEENHQLRLQLKEPEKHKRT